MSTYTIMNDGQFMWPVRTADLARFVREYPGADPFGDFDFLGRVTIPKDLACQIGYGVGSPQCAALCERLIDGGADILSVQPIP